MMFCDLPILDRIRCLKCCETPSDLSTLQPHNYKENDTS